MYCKNYQLQVGFSTKKLRDGIRHTKGLLVSNTCERKTAEAGLYKWQSDHDAHLPQGPKS